VNQKSVVFITGCSSGIGKSLAHQFHHAGYLVIATARNIDSLRELAASGVVTKKLDVNDVKNVESVVADVEREFGGIDILVNNAGFGLISPIIDVEIDRLRHQFETNVFAPLNLVKAVIGGMRARKKGKIVNLGSISGVLTTPFSGAYCASKSAIHALTDSMRMELKPFGIQVTMVQPGAIASSFGDSAGALVEKSLPKDSWYQQIKDQVIGRANISQKNSTSVEVFSEQLVSILNREKIPAVIRLGKLSFQMPFLAWLLPLKVTDKIFAKKFGLDFEA